MKKAAENTVRKTIGQGRWFPADPIELSRMVQSYIENAAPAASSGEIIAAISPHAGLIYSGPIAGHTYRALRDNSSVRQPPETIVIAGFSHSASFRGVALMDGSSIVSPAGSSDLDSEANRILSESSDLIYEDYNPHRGEHSAENQIPFAQTALPKAKLVVAIMGDHSMQTVDAFVEAITNLSRRKKIIFIASTDLLHDADYRKVSRTDKATLETIANLNSRKLQEEWSFENQVCCGIMPVLTAMEFARAAGAVNGNVLCYRNSGDDFPESRGEWVVGYGSVVFTGDQT